MVNAECKIELILSRHLVLSSTTLISRQFSSSEMKWIPNNDFKVLKISHYNGQFNITIAEKTLYNNHNQMNRKIESWLNFDFQFIYRYKCITSFLLLSKILRSNIRWFPKQNLVQKKLSAIKERKKRLKVKKNEFWKSSFYLLWLNKPFVPYCF